MRGLRILKYVKNTKNLNAEGEAKAFYLNKSAEVREPAPPNDIYVLALAEFTCQINVTLGNCSRFKTGV